MRDAGGERAEAGHPIRHQQLGAHPLALGDVAAAGDHAVGTAEHDADRRDLADPPAAVGAADLQLDDVGRHPAVELANLAEQHLGRRAIVGVHAIDQRELGHVVVARAEPEEPARGHVEVDQLPVPVDRDQVRHQVDHGAEARLGLLAEQLGPAAHHRAHRPGRSGADGDRAAQRDQRAEPAGLPPRGAHDEPELRGGAPSPGADPRAHLEPVRAGWQGGVAARALRDRDPGRLDRRQPGLVLDVLGIEQRVRGELQAQRALIVGDLERVVGVDHGAIAERAAQQHGAGRRGRSVVGLRLQVGGAPGRAQPDRAVAIGEERGRGRVIAGQAVALIEVVNLALARGDDVDPGPGADPQPAPGVLSEEVDLSRRQAIRRRDVLEVRDPSSLEPEAGHAQRLVVRDAQPAVGAPHEVAHRRSEEAVGPVEAVPDAVLEHGEALLVRGPQLRTGHDQRREPAAAAPAGDLDVLDRTGGRAGAPIEAELGRDPQRAVGSERERQDRAIPRLGGIAQRRRAAIGRDVQQVGRRAADEHAALRREHEAAHGAALGPGQALPAPGPRARQAAVGADPQRPLRVPAKAPHVLAGEPARGGVLLDQAAAAQLDQPARADPDRALAIDEQRPGRRGGDPDRAVEQAPAVALAIGDAEIGAEQDVPARADHHARRDIGDREVGRQVIVQIDRAAGAAGQQPQVRGRPDPQRALAVAQHAIDELARAGVAGAVRELADPPPRAVSRAQLDGRVVPDDQPVAIGPQRAHAARAGPPRRRGERAEDVADVQPPTVGADPELAGEARDRVHRQRRQAARARLRESRTVPAHQPVDAADARLAGRSDPDHERQARRQAVGHRELREALAVEAIHAVIGGDPQHAGAVLGDAVDHEVSQAVGTAEHAELQLAERDIAARDARVGERGPGRGDQPQDHERAAEPASHSVAVRPESAAVQARSGVAVGRRLGAGSAPARRRSRRYARVSRASAGAIICLAISCSAD